MASSSSGSARRGRAGKKTVQPHEEVVAEKEAGGAQSAPSARGRAGKKKMQPKEEEVVAKKEEDEDQPVCAVCLEPDGKSHMIMQHHSELKYHERT